MKKILYIAIAVMASVLLLCGCSEADRANSNISKQADYFESERKITVYNARTDKVIMEAEGYMSISNNSSNELVCTVKVGPDTYRKNYIYLNSYTMYVVEDIALKQHREDVYAILAPFNGLTVEEIGKQNFLITCKQVYDLVNDKGFVDFFKSYLGGEQNK